METMIDDGPVLVDVPLGSPTRPRWRGRVHLLALWAAVPSLVVLVLLADGARARTAAGELTGRLETSIRALLTSG